MLCNFDRIMQTLANREEQALMAQLLGGAGPTGFVAQLGQHGGHPVLDVWSDLRVGNGLLGSLAAEERTPRLLRWVPDGDVDFGCLALDAGACVRLMRTLMIAQAVEDESMLQEVVSFMDKQWDGEIAGLYKRATGPDLGGEDEELKGVLLVGVDDGVKAQQQITQFASVRRAPELGIESAPPPLLLLDEARTPVAYLVATSDVLFACTPDRESIDILQRAIVTRGQASLPRAWRERARTDPPPGCDAIVLCPAVADILVLAFMAAALGQLDEQPAHFEANTFQTFNGPYAHWLAVDRDGTHLRIHY